MPTFNAADKKLYKTAKELGRGGEGVVYTISGSPNQVAKIYHPERRTPEREDKLTAMVANPPDGVTIAKQAGEHVAIAWPQEILYQNGKFRGFVMPKIGDSPDLFKAINPRLRTRYFNTFDNRHLHRVARNLTAALAALHGKGHVMGDLNHKNVLVTQGALVTLVDCDSFQIKSESGMVHRCIVGVPEYTPPELHGVILDTIDQTVDHDLFGKAVIIFQLLMGGYHPFSGAPIDPNFSIPGKMDLYCIREGIFPYMNNGVFNAPPHAPKFNTLHPDLQRLFIRCFFNGHTNPDSRPETEEWLNALTVAEQALVQCDMEPSKHWYGSHLAHCPWCGAAEAALSASEPEFRAGVGEPAQYPYVNVPAAGTKSSAQPANYIPFDVAPLAVYSVGFNIAGLFLSDFVPIVWNVVAVGLALHAFHYFWRPNTMSTASKWVAGISGAYGLSQAVYLSWWLWQVFG